MGARDEIEAMLAARGEAMMRCDVAGVMDFYVEECELIVGEMPTMSGREAVSEFYRSMFVEGTIQASFVIEDLRADGSLAVFYARELLTVRLRNESVLDQYAMRHMAVLTCGSGGWKFVRIMLALEGPGVAEVAL
jgi:ketosteroid isomerase-like protein